MYKHLFGPVPSRRLGISLGVDLVPHKVCTLNCIYCECGSTTRLTLHRDEYVPEKEIQQEAPVIILTIKDSDGKVIKKINDYDAQNHKHIKMLL